MAAGGMVGTKTDPGASFVPYIYRERPDTHKKADSFHLSGGNKHSGKNIKQERDKGAQSGYNFEQCTIKASLRR